MVNTVDALAYVMDDGLTSLSSDSGKQAGSGFNVDFVLNTNGSLGYITFIGTGISFKNMADSPGTDHFAQNLPYGTHILKWSRGAAADGTYYIDGVSLITGLGTYGGFQEVTFHQPKMPPIPEDAVVLSDYMLMADFVPQTAAGIEKISKGTRRQNISRDIFADETDGDSFTFAQSISTTSGWKIQLSGNADSDTSMQLRLPSFGTNYVQRGYQSDTRSKLFIDTTDNDSSATKDNTDAWGSYAHLASDLTLGVYKFGSNAVSGQNGATAGFDIATPIHTSSHYQTFETPFLHELVGGDRNMEQTNLVVTPDGKTWDQVTRDVSYIGNVVMNGSMSGAAVGGSWTDAVADEWRGVVTIDRFWKDSFVWAYDMAICLKAGYYQVDFLSVTSANDGLAEINLNGTRITVLGGEGQTHNIGNLHHSVSVNLKRGDYLKFKGYNVDWTGTNNFHIIITKV